jgi:hypothetical protein
MPFIIARLEFDDLGFVQKFTTAALKKLISDKKKKNSKFSNVQRS